MTQTPGGQVTPMSERVHSPTSTQELERRWAAVRAAMEDQGIDALVLSNNEDHVGGYVRYFSDMPAVNGYPLSVVFPREEPMSVVGHGPIGGDRAVPVEGDGIFRGVARHLTTASFAPAHFTGDDDPALAAKALEKYGKARIGLVGTLQMSHAFAGGLKRHLPDADFVEASQLVDEIKAIKSEEEQELIRRTCALQDEAMHAVFAAVEPGKRDRDMAAVAQHVSLDLGAEQGVFLCASYTPGEPSMILPPHLQNRVMQAGDVLVMLIETNGPGGQYAELGRACVLGEAPEQLKEELDFVLQAQQFCVDRLKPGVLCNEVANEYNEYMREHDRPEEQRLHCHGQGTDMVERPLVRADETMRLPAFANYACHPGYVRAGVGLFMCDNYLVDDAGETERLHAFPQEIVEL